MRVFLIVMGILAGAAIAFGLNFLFVKKIENKGHRIGMQVVAYVVFTLFGYLFTSIFSLHYTLDRFIDNRINDLELVLSRKFPNTNILEMTFDASEIISLNNELQLALNGMDAGDRNMFERLVFDAFLSETKKYTDAFALGVNTLSTISNDDGTVTIKAILYSIKDLALNSVSPYIYILQIVILVLFLICAGIYIGIAFYLRKGGGTYNKSIVYGDMQ